MVSLKPKCWLFSSWVMSMEDETYGLSISFSCLICLFIYFQYQRLGKIEEQNLDFNLLHQNWKGKESQKFLLCLLHLFIVYVCVCVSAHVVKTQEYSILKNMLFVTSFICNLLHLTKKLLGKDLAVSGLHQMSINRIHFWYGIILHLLLVQDVNMSVEKFRGSTEWYSQ